MMEKIKQYLADNNVAQAAIQHKGEMILDERYQAEPQDVHAIQKGIVALMLGIAQERFLLELFDNMNHHVAPEWTNIGPWEEAKLTIEHLMTMTTGMDGGLKASGTIGDTWFYNNVAYQKLKEILCMHTGHTLNTLTQEWIIEPLGLDQTDWRERDALNPDGTPITALFSTAQDLVKIGEVILNNGAPLISDEHFMAQLAEPGSQDNPAWGLMWWNNSHDRFKLPFRKTVFDGAPLPNAPKDLIFLRGARCEHLGISKTRNLIVAFTANGEGDFNSDIQNELWSLLRAELLS